MATQTVEFQASSGQTITAKLFTPGNDTEVASASATERTNDKGTYRADYTDVAAGAYRLKGLVGSVAACSWRVDLTLSTATFYAREPSAIEYLSDDVIRQGAYDESTAHPLRSADTGTTQVARVGADGDTLETLSDQLDSVTTALAGQTVLTTTIATLASQTSFTLTAGSADDNAYRDCLAIITDASTATQKAVVCICAYTGATKTVRLIAAPAFTVATTDTIQIVSILGTPRVQVDAVLTSSAGAAAHIATWLEFNGSKVDITGATVTVAFRRLDQDTNLFSVTEADLLGATAEFEDILRLLKSSPGFTDDRPYAVTSTITHNGRAFVGTQIIPCLGAT